MRTALAIAQEALPAYAHPCSPKRFTQPQLVACLALKSMLDLDYRGVEALLADCSDLRDSISLRHVPHFTTLQKAAARLLRRAVTRLLFDQIIQAAEQCHILSQSPSTVAVDASGFEAVHTSRYFIRRRARGQQNTGNPLYQTTTYRRFPKAALVVDCRTHLIIASHAMRGPSPDITHLNRIMIDAFTRRRMDTALLDAGYDAEWAHEFLRRDLGIRSIIPPRIGRPTARSPTGRYRAQMWRGFPHTTYGQRWQVETVFSMIKRRQGECLRAVSYHAQCRAIALKALTHNIMILPPKGGSLQSMNVPVFVFGTMRRCGARSFG
jgi:transposase